ncbi:hypothetical protein MTR67_027869 [Solanum verrucosum]|uniref:Uncharacterized protein n=1 Tax=Solanum verrucosum TaxID=315347 RepID=A0AAF0R1F6_SOLVR|nr:hypothetical protein MTR67_027869 [Solanum verrucosum]
MTDDELSRSRRTRIWPSSRFAFLCIFLHGVYPTLRRLKS